MKKNILLAVIAIAVLAFGYYVISPLFKTVEVNDVVPVLSTERTAPFTPHIEQYPVTGTTGHPAEGTLRVIDTDEGMIVRYENFKTMNGPDLYVYLSKDLEGTDFIDLGALKGTEGNINYTIPAGTDLREYRYVLTWCKQFGVLFNYVDISALTAHPATDAMKATSTDTMDDSVMTPAMDTTNAKNASGTPTPADNAKHPVLQTSVVLKKTALLANGCFWCVEHDLEEVTGVQDVVSGYAGGTTNNPTYENYASAGHREVVLVTYDANVVTFANLVEHIIKHGDPTDAKGSFNDRGLEYAPAIYYDDDSEKNEAFRVIHAIDALHVFPDPLPLTVIPRVQFWPAEEYHQNYSEKNPVRYTYYRTGSGRTAFIKEHWGDASETFIVPSTPNLEISSAPVVSKEGSWSAYGKPTQTALRTLLTPLQYKVTQEGDTETPHANLYDKNYAEGIYVDIVSEEPLYSSKDKYDSGTGWPSFVRPLSDDAVVLTEDNTLFTKRTEVRSRYADSHLGHVFDDGPTDRGGKRYCMNSAAMRFIAKADMEKEGYAYLLGAI